MLRLWHFIPSLGLTSLLCLAQSHTDQPAPSQAPAQEKSNAMSPQPVGSSVGSTGTLSTTSNPLFAPPNPLGQAKALYRKGDFDGAVAKYYEVLDENPKSPNAFAGLIHVYLKQKKVDQAAETADQALALSNGPTIRVAHAEVLFRQGKIDLAEKEWVAIINSGAPEARAYLGLARVRRAIANYKSAKTLIDKAHDLDADDPDIQEAWIATLSRSERITYLENTLAGANNWDAERRAATASYLEYLKERAKRKSGACRLVSRITATETPLVRLLRDQEHLRGYGLPVELNGHKSGLMLDTGATGILVKRSIAEKAGISKISAIKVGGIGDKGRRNAFIGIADSIKVGDLEFHDCPIEVMESHSVAGEDGLIGSDVFEDFLVDIDFPDEKLKLSELPKRPGETEAKPALRDEEDDSDNWENAELGDDPKSADAKNSAPVQHPSTLQDRYIAPEMQSFTHVFRFGHDLLVPTWIGDVPYKLFLLDTGALSNLISPQAAREVTKVHGTSDITVKGISGSVNKVYIANKAVLVFGHVRQENQEMIGFDTMSISESAGTEVSGFLGFATLRLLDIKIDYRDALVDFIYDQKR